MKSKEKQKKIGQIQENNATYCLENHLVNNAHDKVFRKILDDKTEAAKFINKVLGLKVKIAKEQLEKYNSSFVTEKLKNQESDIIYKLKGRNIFFLIEHQTKIDYAMPLRILEYESEIIKSAINKEMIGKKDYKFPQVIPIVLYSGKSRWKVKDYIQNVQEELEGYQDVEFAKYNVVDINDYTEEELLQEESFLSKAMLIEKARDTDNLAIYLEKIVEEINIKKKVYTKEQRELLITIIELTLQRKLEKEETEKLIRNLKEGDKPMLAVLEMIDEENKRIFRNGIKEGEKKARKKAAKKMLEENVAIEIIMRVTELSREEVEAMKNNKS